MSCLSLSPFVSSVSRNEMCNAGRFSTSLEANGSWNQEIVA